MRAQVPLAVRVVAVRRETTVPALGTLRHLRVQRNPVVPSRAASAAPRDELVALEAPLLLAATVPRKLRERDEQVLAR